MDFYLHLNATFHARDVIRIIQIIVQIVLQTALFQLLYRKFHTIKLALINVLMAIHQIILLIPKFVKNVIRDALSVLKTINLAIYTNVQSVLQIIPSIMDQELPANRNVSIVNISANIKNAVIAKPLARLAQGQSHAFHVIQTRISLCFGLINA